MSAAYEIPGQRVGVIAASADLRTHQFKGVKFGSTGVALCTTDEVADGILQNKPNTGEMADVMVGGVSKLVASAAIAAGAEVNMTTNGRGVTAVSGKPSSFKNLDVASSADGDIITVLVKYRGLVP